MKITGIETAILHIPEDDPLADMPEDANRKRPFVTLRLRTDQGIEGVAFTFYGDAMTGSLRTAVDELGALILGDWQTSAQPASPACVDTRNFPLSSHTRSSTPSKFISTS